MLNKIALNQGTIKHLPLDQALSVAAKAGYQGFGVWSERVDAFIESGYSYDAAIKVINASGMQIVEIIFLQEWLFVEGDAKIKAMQEINKICKLAQDIKADCICAPAYGYIGDFAVGVRNFKDFCDMAQNYGVKVAIEFVPVFKVSNILQAYKIVESAHKDNGGILVDTFHVFKGTSTLDDLDYIPIEKIFLVHMCDCPHLSSNIDFISQARNYRVFPGQGVFPLRKFISKMKQIKYSGYLSLEILNRKFNQDDPLQVAYAAKEAMQKIII